MKTSRKILLLSLGAGLALIASLQAQDGPPPNGRGRGNRPGPSEQMQQQRQEMITALALTAEQQAKWTEIDRQQMAALAELRHSAKTPSEEARAQRTALMKQFDDQRRATLTPAQQKQFDEVRARQRQQMKARRGKPGERPPPPDGN